MKQCWAKQIIIIIIILYKTHYIVEKSYRWPQYLRVHYKHKRTWISFIITVNGCINNTILMNIIAYK